ncbi:NAD(P)H-binding protein [Streptomyces sp900116325]|uniref:NAD(P)H-binding protein n=1 Tax=Streptomyces sp. 900116325 TaxID=3154295 RepID=UPI0033A76E42
MPELPGAERRGPAAYDDAAAMRAAVDRASTLVLVSGHGTGRRLEEHANAVEAAKAACVNRVLYVSLVGASPTATYLNARDQWMTEQYLAAAGIRHTVLRAGFYASTPAALADENFLVSGPGGGPAGSPSSPTRTSPTGSRPLPSTTIPDQSTTPRSLSGRLGVSCVIKRTLRSTVFTVFAPCRHLRVRRVVDSATRLLRFSCLKSVWFEDAAETPNNRRNDIVRRVHANATT